MIGPGQINKIPACGIFVVACEFLAEACRSLLSDQRLNLGLLHWEHRVLAIGPPDKFLRSLLTEAIGLLLGAATERQAYLFLSSLRATEGQKKENRVSQELFSRRKIRRGWGQGGNSFHTSLLFLTGRAKGPILSVEGSGISLNRNSETPGTQAQPFQDEMLCEVNK